MRGADWRGTPEKKAINAHLQRLKAAVERMGPMPLPLVQEKSLKIEPFATPGYYLDA